MKILIVDDERVVLEGCRLVLQSEGYEVILVSSSDFALEIMEKINPSLLLVDLKMPGHDGMYLLKKVKKNRPDIPIIVMSGYATLETIEEVSAQRADAFIPKPFTPDELIEKIRQVSNGKTRHKKKKGVIITEITGFRKNKKAFIDGDDDIKYP